MQEEFWQREVPDRRWSWVTSLALLVALVGLTAWEVGWRSLGYEPGYRNSAGLWAMTRRQLDRPDPPDTVILGSSRLLFDVDLEAWRAETGTLPTQLALEGTSARPILAHIADESDFGGLVVVGVTPGLFFSPVFGFREDAFRRYRDETPAQRVGQHLSMAIEPYLAFYDPDTALFAVLARQPIWPERLDPVPPPEVRKLSTVRATRQNDLWHRVEHDPEYRRVVTDTWMAIIEFPRPMPPPEEARKMLDALFEEVAGDVRAIRDRGGEVIFVRANSTDRFREAEARMLPRERFWDELLRRTGAVGVHFEDHPELQDVEVPEWSHIRAADTDRWTRALVRILRERSPREELR